MFILRNAVLLLTGVVSGQRGGTQDVPIITDLSEVLGDDYIKLSRGMCFSYDQGLGSYLQTKELINQNSVFEAVADISEIKSGSIAQFCVHRNSYQSLYAQKNDRLALCIRYDKDLSDQHVKDQDLTNGISVFMEIISSVGDIKTQGTVPIEDDNLLNIKIDFQKSWESSVYLNDVRFMDLKKESQDTRAEILKILNSNQDAVEKGEATFNQETLSDQNIPNMYFSMAMFSMSKPSETVLDSKLKIKSVKIQNKELVSKSKKDALVSYDLSAQDVPYFLKNDELKQPGAKESRDGQEMNTMLSKEMAYYEETGGKPGYTLNFHRGSHTYKNKLLQDQKLYSTMGGLTNLKFLSQTVDEQGASIMFDIKADEQRYKEHSFAMTIPLVPFNNEIVISVTQQGYVVTAEDEKSLEDAMADETFRFKAYSLPARVYLRQKYYPYAVLTDTTTRGSLLIFQRAPQDTKLSLRLRPQFVQSDLANMAELVFDFSDVVQQNVEGLGPDFSSLQGQKWTEARITAKDIRMETICRNEIKKATMQKYWNTLVALRDGVLSEQYKTVTPYRVDEESERRLGGIRIAFIIMIIVFIATVLGTGFQIRRYNKSIFQTKIDIQNEKTKLSEHHAEILRLRELKHIRTQIIEEQAAAEEDDEPNPLEGLVGGVAIREEQVEHEYYDEEDEEDDGVDVRQQQLDQIAQN